MLKRLLPRLPLLALLAFLCLPVQAQLNLKVTVHCDEPGTLFVKIQEQIEELGELTDVSELTVTGQLNQDDYNVISNQLKNMVHIDLGGVTNGADYRMKLQCPKLESCVLPRNLTKIWDNCFFGCSKLTSLTIPSTVTEIGGRAFWKCGFESIELPDSITSIESETFYDCNKLKSIKLPAGLTTIKGGAFKFTGFTSFTLPDSVRITGEEAFYGSALESFTFPDGLKTAADVGKGTFNRCRNLKTIRLPQDLEEIPEAFFAYTSLDTIDLPESVTKIGYQAFYGMYAPKRIVLPDRITSIGSQAFYLNKAVEEVVWPAGCTTMNSDMFRYSGIKKITLPETLTTMSGYNHFLETPISSVHLPDALTNISGGMFSQCGNLKEINIPKSCKRIDGMAFWRTALTHVDLPEGLTFIGSTAFSESKLEDLTLPSTIQTISYEAFASCKFTDVVVPEGCVYVGDAAFYGDSLKTIDLPSTLIATDNIIGGYKCRVEKVTLRALMPPACKDNFFSGRNAKDTVTFYVPAVSIESYKNDSKYSGYKEIVAIEDGKPTSDKFNIAGGVTLASGSKLTDRKYDVAFVYGYLDSNRGLFDSQLSTEHPRLIIQDGAALSASNIKMNCYISDYQYSNYPWDCLINQGSLTADDIDLRWQFNDMCYYCPPFDIKISDIVPEIEGAPFAFFRYNNAARAVGDFSNTWIRMNKNETLKAGQGYIQRSQTVNTGEYDDWNHSWIVVFSPQHHYPQKGGTNYFITNADVTLPMTHASGEFAHNKNWNLVGNPYPAFLDIRGVDYDGPILLRTSPSNANFWQAYSPLDDEYVLHPYMPIFIQAPDGVESITLKANRRQASKVFVKGNTSNSRMNTRRADKNQNRTVYNLTMSNGTNEANEPLEVRTRFVINPEATSRYDIGRDAPAMAADSVDLLYTMAGGVAYAINERPLGDGIVRLGIQTAQPGTYTLRLSEKNNKPGDDIWLIDNRENTRTLLLSASGEQRPYTFEVSEAGTIGSRFVIAIGNAEPTAIEEAELAVPQRIDGVFNLAGQQLGNSRQRGIVIKNGKKVIK